MDAIFQTDSAILLWIQNSVRSDFLTTVMTVITRMGDKGILWIAVTLALLAFRRTRRMGLMCLISMAIGLTITNLIIKNWVARIRPYVLIEGLECLIGPQKDFSFPSGHTTNSFACAWVLFMRTRRRRRWLGITALIMAILIGLSRLYVGVHYPTDVLGGAAVGIISACLAMALVPMLERRFPKLKRLYRRRPNPGKGTRTSRGGSR